MEILTCHESVPVWSSGVSTTVLRLCVQSHCRAVWCQSWACCPDLGASSQPLQRSAQPFPHSSSCWDLGEFCFHLMLLKILLCYGSARVSHLGACKPRGAQICRSTCCFKLMSGWSSESMMSWVFSDARDPILVTIFSVIPSPSQLSVCKRDYGRSSREVLGTIVASVTKEAIREWIILYL